MADDPQTSPSDARLAALVNRLVRTLPRPDEVAALREAIAGIGDDDPILRAVLECVAALRASSARFQPLTTPPPLPSAVPEASIGRPLRAPARHGTEPLPALEFHDRPTMALPALGTAEPAAAATRPVPVPAAVEVHWTPAEQMLYEDILTLFELGDQSGAMISVERLLMLSPEAQELGVFLERNEATLKRIYEEYFGSLNRIPVPLRNAHPVKIPTPDAATVMDVLRLVDGQRTIREVIRLSKLGEVRGLVCLAHLARSGFIELA